MASITLDGKPAYTIGELPKLDTKAPDFKLVAEDLTTKTLSDFKNYKLILNVFPSIETGVCSASVRNFNKKAAELDNTKVLCISRDLPFTQKKFCAAEGIENVVMLSDFRTGSFGEDYQLTLTNSIFEGLLSRCVIVIDTLGIIKYTEQVEEIGKEPDYEAALEAINNA